MSTNAMSLRQLAEAVAEIYGRAAESEYYSSLMGPYISTAIEDAADREARALCEAHGTTLEWVMQDVNRMAEQEMHAYLTGHPLLPCP